MCMSRMHATTRAKVVRQATSHTVKSQAQHSTAVWPMSSHWRQPGADLTVSWYCSMTGVQRFCAPSKQQQRSALHRPAGSGHSCVHF